jgi:hypothetical protein
MSYKKYPSTARAAGGLHCPYRTCIITNDNK